tara:strand:+ start:2203 stop:2352 length:150 start_codon:yes stop_codon:yes gene_type:complete
MPISAPAGTRLTMASSHLSRLVLAAPLDLIMAIDAVDMKDGFSNIDTNT